MKVTTDNLNSAAEFYCAFLITDEGLFVNAPGTGAPETVMHDAEDDYSDQIGEWVPVDGFSGQHGYSGPVMHPSEFLGGGMATHVLETPGLYVLVEVVTEPDEDHECPFPEDCDFVPVGWMLLHREV